MNRSILVLYLRLLKKILLSDKSQKGYTEGAQSLN